MNALVLITAMQMQAAQIQMDHTPVHATLVSQEMDLIVTVINDICFILEC